LPGHPISFPVHDADQTRLKRFSKAAAEKVKDLVATGILPVMLNRQAGSLSHQAISGTHMSIREYFRELVWREAECSSGLRYRSISCIFWKMEKVREGKEKGPHPKNGGALGTPPGGVVVAYFRSVGPVTQERCRQLSLCGIDAFAMGNRSRRSKQA
jgi:hypothetical protein